MIRLCSAFLTTACLACVLTTPADALIFDDDFEDAPQGAWPLGWAPSGNAATNRGANKVTSDPTEFSNQTLQLHGVLGGNWGAIAYHPCEFSDAFTISLRVFNGTEYLTGNQPNRGSIGLKHGQHWYWATNPGATLLTFREVHLVTALDGTTIKNDYELNRWHEVEMTCKWQGFDLTVDYRIDGNDLGSRTQTFDWSGTAVPGMNPSLLDNLSLTVGEGTVLFDDVRVTGPDFGDFTGDGSVDQDDLTLLLRHWGDVEPPSSWARAWDGCVDQNELSGLLRDWGTGAGAATAVPEPSSIALLFVGGTLGALACRRRKS